MRAWSVQAVGDFLRRVDLCAAAKLCEAKDVNGQDLLEADLTTLTDEVLLPAWTARKILTARNKFLQPPDAEQAQGATLALTL